MSHWNIGERALHSGMLMHTEWQSDAAASHDPLPVDMSHAIFTAAHVVVTPQVTLRPPVVVEEDPVESTEAKVISKRPPPASAEANTTTVNT